MAELLDLVSADLYIGQTQGLPLRYGMSRVMDAAITSKGGLKTPALHLEPIV